MQSLLTQHRLASLIQTIAESERKVVTFRDFLNKVSLISLKLFDMF